MLPLSSNQKAQAFLLTAVPKVSKTRWMSQESTRPLRHRQQQNTSGGQLHLMPPFSAEPWAGLGCLQSLSLWTHHGCIWPTAPALLLSHFLLLVPHSSAGFHPDHGLRENCCSWVRISADSAVHWVEENVEVLLGLFLFSQVKETAIRAGSEEGGEYWRAEEENKVWKCFPAERGHGLGEMLL